MSICIQFTPLGVPNQRTSLTTNPKSPLKCSFPRLQPTPKLTQHWIASKKLQTHNLSICKEIVNNNQNCKRNNTLLFSSLAVHKNAPVRLECTTIAADYGPVKEMHYCVDFRSKQRDRERKSSRAKATPTSLVRGSPLACSLFRFGVVAAKAFHRWWSVASVCCCTSCVGTCLWWCFCYCWLLLLHFIFPTETTTTPTRDADDDTNSISKRSAAQDTTK